MLNRQTLIKTIFEYNGQCSFHFSLKTYNELFPVDPVFPVMNTLWVTNNETLEKYKVILVIDNSIEFGKVRIERPIIDAKQA